MAAQLRMHDAGAAGETVAARPSTFRLRRQVSQRHLTTGSYLTDGRKPFRVSSQFVHGRSVKVWIEDCLTLETRARAACELEAMGIRAVGKAYAQAVAGHHRARGRLGTLQLSTEERTSP
jgi:hypothetical protein